MLASCCQEKDTYMFRTNGGGGSCRKHAFRVADGVVQYRAAQSPLSAESPKLDNFQLFNKTRKGRIPSPSGENQGKSIPGIELPAVRTDFRRRECRADL